MIVGVDTETGMGTDTGMGTETETGADGDMGTDTVTGTETEMGTDFGLDFGLVEGCWILVWKEFVDVTWAVRRSSRSELSRLIPDGLEMVSSVVNCLSRFIGVGGKLIPDGLET